jgi:hypothetical protein
MLHVFVETNWVIDFITPFQAEPAARALLEHAQAGRLFLHLPGICLNEAQNKINLRKAEGRTTADRIRNFLRSQAGQLPAGHAEIVYRTLDIYERLGAAEIANFEQRLQELYECPNVDVFALDDDMLRKSLALTGGDFAELKPFDQAILAGVLVRAASLREHGAIVFCELDNDLQPWTRKQQPKPWLEAEYAPLGIIVQGNFDVSEHLDP